MTRPLSVRRLALRSGKTPLLLMRAIPGKTMIVVGDADGVALSHALLFAARGGDNVEAATQGFMTAAPRARLAILPATTHVGMMSERR